MKVLNSLMRFERIIILVLLFVFVATLCGCNESNKEYDSAEETGTTYMESETTCVTDPTDVTALKESSLPADLTVSASEGAQVPTEESCEVYTEPQLNFSDLE